ncbi:MAG: OstA-like protein [Bacteroidales bacterium]|nr:OstA-like protein [Bacteroidales bacterium]MDD4655977.1 OstA-like protein [Bacteroidales bacterium]
MKLRCLYSVFLILLTFTLNAQQAEDQGRLVRLIKAETAETYENELLNIKKVTGNAQFLHNNALIICDTAIWDVSKNIIDAIGNVKIIQESTTLSGDRIHYIADSSLAQVRGSIVELLDGDSNRLRTFFLDYNTKDSIAYFYKGGSMMDTAGRVIESLRGYYHSKIDRFKFLEEVEMATSDMVLKSDSLTFWTQTNKVDFLGQIMAWQNSAFLTSKTGWYNKEEETYNFVKDAYILNSQNEIWGDRILYQKALSTAQLWDNVQIVDTAQSIILFSDYAIYQDNKSPSKDSLTWVKLYNNPSIAYYSIENETPDTLFFSADTIHYRDMPLYLVDSATIASSNKRYKNSQRDPIKEMYGQPIEPVVADSIPLSKEKELLKSIKESTLITDSTLQTESAKLSIDSTTFVKEPTLVKDTTLIRFVDAKNSVKFYRSDFQGKCDSLRFNSIDSIIRLYKEPVLWNENNQFLADSIQLLVAQNSLKRVDFMSNSFIIAPEDSIHNNQIKSTDMVAFFTEGDLSRFDAYGSVSLIIFLQEDSIITTMNKKECKVMTAKIKNRAAERIKYIDNIPSDAYPIIDLEPDQKLLKDFKLFTEQKPKDRYAVCDRSIIPSKREEVTNTELPQFKYTWILFRIKPQLPISTIDQIEKEPPIKQKEESSLP